MLKIFSKSHRDFENFRLTRPLYISSAHVTMTPLTLQSSHHQTPLGGHGPAGWSDYDSLQGSHHQTPLGPGPAGLGDYDSTDSLR